MNTSASSPFPLALVSDLVLVTGAGGQTGSLVAAGLRERGVPVRAVARGTEPRFDWDDSGTWDPVLAGVTAVYLVTPLLPDFDAALVRDFLDRARAAGVRRLVLLSGASGEFGGVPILSREQPLRAIDEDDLAWTVLRPNVFAQNFPAMEPTLLTDGGYHRPLGPAPGPRVAYVDVRDIADVAVEILASAAPEHAGRTYYLDGPDALTSQETLDLVGGRTGVSLTYREVSRQEWAKAARAAGVTPEWVEWGLAASAGQRRGEYAHLRDDIRRLLGREPRSLSAYLDEAVRAGAWRPN
ncbi:NAD(P)H-binding protein [Streptomyces arenae]|nr:NAD(P)H-binding protein [Streptomyces arenae]